MATKDKFFLFKDEHKSFKSCLTETGAQYSDLNLHRNVKRSNIFPIHSNSKSTFDKKIDSKLSKIYEEKEKSQTSKKSSAKDFNDEIEKCWKKNYFSKVTNDSLLHIYAYENSNEALSDSLNKSFQKSLLIQKQKQINPSSTFILQNPFEFPRQQNSDEKIDPEIMILKTSQKLYSNQASNNRPPMHETGKNVAVIGIGVCFFVIVITFLLCVPIILELAGKAMRTLDALKQVADKAVGTLESVKEAADKAEQIMDTIEDAAEAIKKSRWINF